jgi:ABC-type multidrug transport system fused ATPase/permease subunit
MTDSKTPEWATDKAIESVNYSSVSLLSPDEFDAVIRNISQALLSVYERGRKEGIEEAAKVVQAHSATVALPDEDVVRFGMFARQANRSDLSQAIRQLLEVKG